MTYSSFPDLANLQSVARPFFDTACFIAGGAADIAHTPYPDEQQLIATAVASRQRDFCSGRHYARQALQLAGLPAVAIGRGERGNPLWPADCQGSISHDQGWAVALIVAPATGIAGVGIDLLADPAAVTAELQPMIASSAELEQLAVAFPDLPSLGLAFSLKEAAIKAVSPSLNDYLEFTDLQLSVDKGRLRASGPAFEGIIALAVYHRAAMLVTLARWPAR